MIKVKVIENFTLGKFNELKNIVRSNPKQDLEGRLFVNDIFKCTEEMAEYLTKTNAQGKPFVEVMEIIPKETKKEKTVTKKSTTKKSTTTSKKTIAKKD